MRFVLAFTVLLVGLDALAYPIFPSTHLSLAERVIFSDYRASLAPPTAEDYNGKRLLPAWETRLLEEKMEDTFMKAATTPVDGPLRKNHPRSVLGLLTARQRDIEYTRGQASPMSADLVLWHLPDGALMARVPLRFKLEWNSVSGRLKSVALESIDNHPIGESRMQNAQVILDALAREPYGCALLL